MSEESFFFFLLLTGSGGEVQKDSGTGGAEVGDTEEHSGDTKDIEAWEAGREF